MTKILIIEDDETIREELALILETEGYLVVAVADFNNVAAAVRKEQPALILLDIVLPGQDGFKLCSELRKSFKLPIIFVTSKDTTMDELQGLSLGADDYITKPYNVPLLLARIKTVLRRGGSVEETLEVAGLSLDLARGSMSFQGQTGELTKNELKILYCLMTQAGKIVPRSDLVEFLWEQQIYIDENTLSVNITRLRGKLKALGLPEAYIQTRRGLGYQI